MLELMVLLTWATPFLIGMWALRMLNFGGSGDADGPPPPPDPSPPPLLVPPAPGPYLRPRPRPNDRGPVARRTPFIEHGQGSKEERIRER